MINLEKLIRILQQQLNNESNKRALDIINSNQINLYVNSYNKPSALRELIIHKESMEKAGINYFGYSALISQLENLNDENIIICNCCNERYILQIYLQNKQKLIGAIGVEKQKLSDEEKKIALELAKEGIPFRQIMKNKG